ncbi:MAG TPA: pyrroloquinoline quinone biosynthesis peptide chaperone PqqD [Chthoniobacteraceae bacterium]|nr:pyrroloquinoline quinone biosynthesis peptide chaperone PqqD [Chthoniobacteraceae bacterium]
MNAADFQLRPVLAARVRLQKDPVTGEPVLLYPEGVLILNRTAHEIVSRCDGVATIERIVATLSEEYEAPADQLAADVAACLDDLRRRNLIVLSP